MYLEVFSEQIDKTCPELAGIFGKFLTLCHRFREKLAASDRQAELTSILDVEEQKAADFIKSYLDIKQEPDFYHNSQERLAELDKSLNALYKTLLVSLRDFNDGLLKDTAVSQRLVASKAAGLGEVETHQAELDAPLTIDNRELRLADVLREEIKPGSRLKIAAATFSMFAYQELKKELEAISELQFIFTSPTFTRDEYEKKYREYTIPKRDREGSVFGRQYELKLMNELTQKALAKECADWVRRKVRFKSINHHEDMDDGLRIETSHGVVSLDRFKNFGRKELGYEPTTLVNTRRLYKQPHSLQYLKNFEENWQNDALFRDVTEEVLEHLNLAYKEQSPEFLYYVMIYNIFGDFLEDVSQDHEPNEMVKYKESKIWNLLYDFQKDAVESIVSKLERFNGCILADSVGLGKTFTALAVMTYYAYRGKRILVLCPKKLENNWNMYRHDYKNNPIYDRYLQYDVLFHTDLSRETGLSNGIDLSLNRFDTYDLVVIDESHAFRNGGSSQGDLEQGRENRYTRLMNRIIKEGVPTKVLMLSATPVNNRFNDLKNQLALAYEGDSKVFNQKLGLKSTIDDIFRQAQAAHNKWADLPVTERTTERLLESLDFDFFKVLDSVTIARSRRHIREFYDSKAIGDFPNRLEPVNRYPDLAVSKKDLTYQAVYDLLDQLQLTIYQPSRYIFPSKLGKYEKDSQRKSQNLTQSGREAGIKKLMMVNLLKRLESSVEAFRHTLLKVVKSTIEETVAKIEAFHLGQKAQRVDAISFEEQDFDVEDSNNDLLIGKNQQFALTDMDCESWYRELKADLDILDKLEALISQITPDEDDKLRSLKALIDDKMVNPINEGNRKLLIFSAFATTTDYLYQHIAPYVQERYGLYTAMVSGTDGLRTNLKLKEKQLNTILTYFSPKSKGKSLLYPDDEREIDILIATDVISEGQNLQDCDTVVNFDIHWNPVRIIQRFGRVDRIGSQNASIQLVNFWPNIALDDYINLKARVESRMRISVLASTGDDNLLTDEEAEDNTFRLKQLERLKQEVVDLEEMSDGVSIMDLGLEDYRRNLLSYLKDHPDLEKMPKGLQAVVQPAEDKPEGAIFVLEQKGQSQQVHKREKNRLHPYLIVYVDDRGKPVYQVSDAKGVLDYVRLMTKGKSSPDPELVERYNHLTQNGADMSYYSNLLQEAINLLVDADGQSTVEALFGGYEVDLFSDGIEGKDDFELVCFFALLKGGQDVTTTS